MLTLSKPPPVEIRPPVAMTETARRSGSVEVLAEVDRLLQAGRPQEAVDAIGDAYLACPWTANALAVCHLRLGNTARAVRHLRYIATDHASARLRDDVPVVFRTNLATALLADGDVEGFLGTLDQLAGVDHPYVQRLRAAAVRWEQSLTVCEKLFWNVCRVVLRRPRLDPPIGELSAWPAGVQHPTDCLRHRVPPEAGVADGRSESRAMRQVAATIRGGSADRPAGDVTAGRSGAEPLRVGAAEFRTRPGKRLWLSCEQTAARWP